MRFKKLSRGKKVVLILSTVFVLTVSFFVVAEYCFGYSPLTKAYGFTEEDGYYYQALPNGENHPLPLKQRHLEDYYAIQIDALNADTGIYITFHNSITNEDVVSPLLHENDLVNLPDEANNFHKISVRAVRDSISEENPVGVVLHLCPRDPSIIDKDKYL